MAKCVVCSVEIREDARFCPSCGAEQPKQGPKPGSGDDPLIGLTINRNFKIEGLLGVGGMGKVYKARQLSLDKTVVIKILHDHFQTDPQLVQRFQREARAASRLNHPNSIQVLDFGQDAESGVLFMALEYLEGKDLFSVLQSQGPLPADRIARIMTQVCSALAEAHEHNVIHRDLKPENIMVEDRRGQRDFVKVLDFGIAKIQDPNSGQQQALTQAGMVCGTPEYMSPEQARGLELDPRSDLYSLGVVAYQLATGELPFHADTPIGIVTKHILEQPVPPRQKKPDIPEALEAIILRAMQKDPGARFQSAVEMGEAFEALLRAPPPQPLAAPAPAGRTGTMVGAPLAAPSSTLAQPGAAKAGPPASIVPTEDSQPAVRTVSAGDVAASGQRPTTTSPTPSGIQGGLANLDDTRPPPGGGLKWVAVAAIALFVVGGGGVLAFKDQLFGKVEGTVGGPVALRADREPPTPEKTDKAQEEGPAPAEPAADATAEATGAMAVAKAPKEKPKSAKRQKREPRAPKPEEAAPAEAPRPLAGAEEEPREPKVRERFPRIGRGRAVSPADKRRARELQQEASALALSSDPKERTKAYKMLKEALKLDPTNPDPIRAISFIHQRNGDHDKACNAMKDFIRRRGLGPARGRPLLKSACKDAE